MPDHLPFLHRNLTLLKDGNLIQRHIRCEFILQAVDLDELAVQLFLIGVQLVELAGPVLFVHLCDVFKSIGIHKNSLAVILFVDANQFVLIEVPR